MLIFTSLWRCNFSPVYRLTFRSLSLYFLPLGCTNNELEIVLFPATIFLLHRLNIVMEIHSRRACWKKWKRIRGQYHVQYFIRYDIMRIKHSEEKHKWNSLNSIKIFCPYFYERIVKRWRDILRKEIKYIYLSINKLYFCTYKFENIFCFNSNCHIYFKIILDFRDVWCHIPIRNVKY